MNDGAGRVEEIRKGRGEFVGEEVVSGVARGGVRGVKSEGAGIEQREGGESGRPALAGRGGREPSTVEVN